jgi:hypothetical protein
MTSSLTISNLTICRLSTYHAAMGHVEGENRMSASGEDRISTFERHCGLLLRAYPAAYRSERGEEIVSTLLETTPEGRDWPLPRDIRGLVTGGLHARAVLNRRSTTSANLRVAVLVGVAAYLAFAAADHLGALLFAAGRGDGFRWASPVPPGSLLAAHGQQPERGGAVGYHAFQFHVGVEVLAALIIVTLVLAWLSRRRAIVLAGALPAVAALAAVGSWRSDEASFGSTVMELACLGVLIAVAGTERPGRRWLWLIGPIGLAGLLAASTLPATGPAAATGVLVLCLLVTLAMVSVALVPIDARPAIAIAVFLLGLWLSAAIGNIGLGSAVFSSGLPFLGICTAVTAAAVWRLRRQSAHAGRPARSS